MDRSSTKWSKEADRALSERTKGFSVAWDPMMRGTFNDGRNAAKRERKARSDRLLGIVRGTAGTAKPVRPAFHFRLSIVKRAKVLTHAPRSRVGSTTPSWLRRMRNRRRDQLARASR